jgi:hypothetical protein
MPLTPMQKDVLRLLAHFRNPDSHAGGGAVINRADDSPRYSSDLDLFHNVADSVARSAEADVTCLAVEGFTVEWSLRLPLLHRARVARGGEQLGLDWCFDSAFRFFPVQPDPEFGYCLHPADVATNKVLALAGRSEVRDYLDILYLHENYLSLGAVCWAASGKDQGLTPWMILDFARRHVKFREDDLARERLTRPVRLTDLREAWTRAAAEAETWFARLPAADVGCLYLGPDGKPFTPDPADPGFPEVPRHFGSVRGAWPKPS